MADLLGNILVGYAAAAWDAGYRSEDRTMLGMILGVSDEDLDTICNLLSEWEREDDGSGIGQTFSPD
jgi:hypothetical protein